MGANMIKLRPTIVVLIIGIIAFIIGVSLISIGASDELPVFESKNQERQGSIVAYKADSTMIAVGIVVTVAGLGLTLAGGFYTWRNRV
jgi:hypothetical protein